MTNSAYKPVIGFEIHVQLATKSKMFSPAPNNPDEAVPNTNIDEIVTGQPGTLPVANKEAIRLAAMVGLALNCTIDEFSKFDRKHYFYPDLPKGYQISQYDQPIAKKGYLDIEVNGKTKRIGITRAHLEEDAGKNVHPEGLPYSLVDYNRAGAPLLEIVTEPDIESAEEGRAFLQELRNIIRYLGASSADMEKGTMRCEPNISVRKPGETTLPKYKVEVKNINSFKFAEAAINFEIARHTEMLEKGEMPRQVTMGWNEKNNCTVEQRSKEDAQDYRYMPDPDLPVLQFPQEYLDELRNRMPELPAQKRTRFLEEYKLPLADVENLINWKELTYYFEGVVSEIDEWINSDVDTKIFKDRISAGEPMASLVGWDRLLAIRQAANWCLGEFSALLNQKLMNPYDSAVTPENFAEMLKLIQQGKISVSAAKSVFKVMYEKGGDPSEIVEDMGLAQVSDEGAIAGAIEKVIAENPKAVTDYKAGQQKSFGFLVGQCMKELKGKGNPQVINDLLKKKLA
ncbi:MAG: Asp-tRNA(Asn)/Glu-tRNA(Gln) amidotransferase subunit GatB [Patescibacteria group bacterium]|nr:Asp-tRNA(Asn)/Glu-tRNA(Gln) amidotransferase subunit GatB [Patescibacteria group bacterium]